MTLEELYSRVSALEARVTELEDKQTEVQEDVSNLSGACESCGVTDSPYRLDPYIAEIHGDHSKRFLCDECAHERTMDI